MHFHLLTSLAFFFTVALCDPIDLVSTSRNLRLRAPDPANFTYEQLTFTFHGGPASYTLTFPADGNSYPTNNDMSVNIISPGAFPALYECNFYTTGYSRVVFDTTQTGNDVDIGPPQPILSVACAATGSGGSCLPVYASCEFDGPNGVFLLPCCSGYCAATKCRCTTPGGCN